MALKKQILHVPFGAGVDEGTHKYLTEAPVLSALSNAVFEKNGALRKRNGATALATAISIDTNEWTTDFAAISAADAMASYVNELVLFTDERALAFSSDHSEWQYRGLAISGHCKSSTFNADPITDQHSTQVWVADGNVVRAWQEGSGSASIYVSVIDLATGTTIINRFLATSSGQRPILCTLNTTQRTIGLFYAADSLTDIRGRVITLTASAPSVGSEVVIKTDLDSSNPNFDVSHIGAIDYACLVYNNSTPEVHIVYVDVALAVVSSPAGVTLTGDDASDDAISVLENTASDTVCVAWATSGNVLRFASRDTTALTETVAAKNLVTGLSQVEQISLVPGSYNSGNGVKVFYQQADSVTGVEVDSSDGTIPSYSIGPYAESGIAAKGFTNGDIVYLPMWRDSPGLYPHLLLMAMENQDASAAAVIHMEQVARWSAGLGDADQGLFVSNLSPTTPLSPATGSGWAFGAEKYNIQLDAAGDNLLGRKTAAQYEFYVDDPARSFASDTYGATLHLAGGNLQTYDGVSVTPTGFNGYPAFVLSDHGSGSGPGAGTYNYIIALEWIDAKGQRHRGPTSPSQSIVMGTGNSVRLVVDNMNVDNRRDKILVAIYRTVTTGTVYFRTGELQLDEKSLTRQATDDTSDANLTDNEILYTTGGVLSNDPPPSCSFVKEHRGRLWLGGCEVQNEIWPSKLHVPGLGPEFVEAFALRVGEEGEPVTGLASLDDKLIVFKRDKMYAVYGDGPDAAGNGQFSDPQLIASDVGCTNARSLVNISDGVMFKSARGIYILSRGLDVQYVGIGVEDELSQTVSSAVLVEEDNHVRFGHSGSTEETLVYNYQNGQWAKWANHVSVHAVEHAQVYHQVVAGGTVYKETDGVYDDRVATTHALLSATTSWLKLAGMQGYQRIRRAQILGEHLAQSGLKVEIGYDYETAFTDTITFDDALLDSSGPMQVTVHIPRQKCQSIRFRITEIGYNTQVGGEIPNAGFELTSLMLEVGIKEGLFKQPATLKA